MRVTRRGLFATIAAAFVAKPAIKGLPLALVRSYDRSLIKCQCPSCQWKRGALREVDYSWYPDVNTCKANALLTRQEITHKTLQVLENNTVVLPNFWSE